MCVETQEINFRLSSPIVDFPLPSGSLFLHGLLSRFHVLFYTARNYSIDL